MIPKGIVISGPDQVIEKRAESRNLPVVIDSEMPMVFEKIVFTDPGIRLPWDLLNNGFYFLNKWDVAIPLWRYGINGGDVGSESDRRKTKKIVRDLRVLLHSVEMMFVKNNDEGRALVAEYLHERDDGGDKRLAFLRALYIVKPKVCVLPTSWLADVVRGNRFEQYKSRGRRRSGKQLVVVEIGQGRFIKCQPGDEDKVLELMRSNRK